MLCFPPYSIYAMIRWNTNLNTEDDEGGYRHPVCFVIHSMKLFWTGDWPCRINDWPDLAWSDLIWSDLIWPDLILSIKWRSSPSHNTKSRNDRIWSHLMTTKHGQPSELYHNCILLSWRLWKMMIRSQDYEFLSFVNHILWGGGSRS